MTILNFHFLFTFLPIILGVIKSLSFFDFEPSVISINPIVYIDLLFFRYLHNSLFSLNLFCNFLNSDFNDSCLIFTDGSVGISSADFSFFIPSLNISFLDNLSGFSSLFNDECWAIYYALLQIQSLSVDNFLIISDSQSAQ